MRTATNLLPTPALPLATQAIQVIRTDAEGRIVWVNHAFLQNTGYVLNELRGRTPGQVLQGTDTKEVEVQRMRVAIRQGTPCFGVELVNYRKDQTSYRVRIDIEPERDESGAIVGFISAQQQIGEGGQREHQVHLKRWLVFTEDQLKLNCFERYEDPRLDRWSEGMYRLWGLPSSRPPMTIAELVSRMVVEDREPTQVIWRGVQKEGDTGTARYRVLTFDGRLIWVQSDWRIYSSPTGVLVAVGSLRDITDTMDSQRKAERAQAQLLLAVETANVGIARDDLLTGRWYGNAAAKRMFDQEKSEESLTLDVLARVHPEDQIAVQRARDLAIKDGVEDHELHFRVQRDGKAPRHIRSRRLALQNAEGVSTELLSVLIEVTDLVEGAERERSLSESRELALSLSGLGAWSMSHIGAPIHFDERQLSIFGWSPDDPWVPVEKWLNAVHPDDRSRVDAAWSRVRDGHTTEGKESFRIIRPAGDVRWLEVNYAVLRSAQSKVTGLHGTVHDVTDRELTLEALRLECSVLATSERLAKLGSWRRNLRDQSDYWSAELYRICGRPPELGPPSIRSPQDIRGGGFALMQAIELATSERQTEAEIAINREDGSQGVVIVHSELEHDLSGVPIVRVSCVRDITDVSELRQKSESALRRLQALFDGAINGILLTDDTGRCIDANPAICKMLGHTHRELIEKSISDIVMVSQATVALPGTWWQFVDGHHDRGMVQLRCKDNSLIAAEYAATAAVLPGLHLSILSDVSSRMRAQRAAEEAESRLRDLAARQLDQFDELRADLARDVHDQLGQPLSALVLEVGVLAPRLGDDIHRLQKLLQQTIATTRDLSRTLRPAAMDLSLPLALGSLADEVSMGSDVDVASQICPEAAELSPVATRAIYRVVQEALNNVVRHSGARTALISAELRDGFLRVTVSDDGVGLDTTAMTPGLGTLGMQERARQIGASLSLGGRRGKGTQVTLDVPT